MKQLLDAINRWLGSGNLWSAVKILSTLAVISALLIYFGVRMASEIQPSPCSPDGFPARCYRIAPEMCDLIWKKSEETCKAFLQKLALPPGRLIGPFVFKCQAAGLDKTFLYSRKSSHECDELFYDLEDWRKRNDIK